MKMGNGMKNEVGEWNVTMLEKALSHASLASARPFTHIPLDLSLYQ